MQDLQCRDTLQCPHVLHHQGSPVSTNLQWRSGFSGLLGRIQEWKKLIYKFGLRIVGCREVILGIQNPHWRL